METETQVEQIPLTKDEREMNDIAEWFDKRDAGGKINGDFLRSFVLSHVQLRYNLARATGK